MLVLYPLLLAMIMGGSRIVYRAWKEGHLRRMGGDGKRVIVLGAGTAAANLLKNLGRSPEWHFIGLLDDDPTKQRREIQGVRVLGTLADLPEIAAREGVEIAVIAMPDQSHRVRRRALELSRSAGLQAMTVPSYEDLVGGKVTVSQLRRVELDDLLGRDPVELDAAGLREWLVRAHGARDRRGRLDRRGAVPADPALRAGATRRAGAERAGALHARAGVRRAVTARRGSRT